MKPVHSRIARPAPNEGRDSEACRRANCAAVGINPDEPLASTVRVLILILAILCIAAAVQGGQS